MVRKSQSWLYFTRKSPTSASLLVLTTSPKFISRINNTMRYPTILLDTLAAALFASSLPVPPGLTVEVCAPNAHTLCPSLMSYDRALDPPKLGLCSVTY